MAAWSARRRIRSVSVMTGAFLRLARAPAWPPPEASPLVRPEAARSAGAIIARRSALLLEQVAEVLRLGVQVGDLPVNCASSWSSW
jgi:hypothetical protein